MKETIQLVINFRYAHLLFAKNEGEIIYNKLSGKPDLKIVELSTDDPRYKQIPDIEKKIKKRNYYFSFGEKITVFSSVGNSNANTPK